MHIYAAAVFWAWISARSGHSATPLTYKQAVVRTRTRHTQSILCSTVSNMYAVKQLGFLRIMLPMIQYVRHSHNDQEHRGRRRQSFKYEILEIRDVQPEPEPTWIECMSDITTNIQASWRLGANIGRGQGVGRCR